MKPGKDDLVRVRSESELRAGMTVWKRVCVRCGKTHAVILLRSYPHAGRQRCSLNGECTLDRSWALAGDCPGVSGCTKRSCFWRAIAEGRLYRLRDLDDQQEATRERQPANRQPAH